uniref:WGS project CBMG000000000 data, contig CS5907-c002068 n=1 Tax=Fusarium acuminatum CS5907 TaxID=1318461 RepID=A0A090M9D4_9HYPO|nr:unnamed protein product [Fusarium acuminatum CS5907]
MTTYFSTHCRGHRLTLEKLATEKWPNFHANEQLSEDDDFQKQFNRYIEEEGNVQPAGIL